MRRFNVTNLFFISYIVFAFLLGCDENEPHPKDDQLIQNFQSHKIEFNQLLQMFQQDKSLGRVASDFTRSASFFEKCEGLNAWNGKEVEVSDERLNEYRRLFVTLKLPKGIEGYCRKNTIWFYASTKGFSITGSAKGYVYALKKPEPLADNLDDYQSPDGKSFTAYKHIEGNWYLFLEFED